MKKDDQVNAVALHLRGVMDMLNGFFDELVGRNQHNIILVVCAGDVEQYVANVPRERGVASLQHLLARWKVGLPDTLPGEQTPGDTAAFELLLNEFERAATQPDGTGVRATRDNARSELLVHVGSLIAQANRGKGAA